MVEVMKIMVTSFKRSHAHSAVLSTTNPAAATADPCFCQRLLDTHKQVWVSLLWGHCFFLLGPGAHKLLFVPSKSLFLHPKPLPLQQSTGDPHLHRRLLDTHRQVWVSLLWGHCSFLLGHTRYCLCLPRVCFPSPV